MSASTSRTSSKPQPPPKVAPKEENPIVKAVEKPKEINLFDFDDDPTPAVTSPAPPQPAPISGDGASSFGMLS